YSLVRILARLGALDRRAFDDQLPFVDAALAIAVDVPDRAHDGERAPGVGCVLVRVAIFAVDREVELAPARCIPRLVIGRARAALIAARGLRRRTGVRRRHLAGRRDHLLDLVGDRAERRLRLARAAVR